MQLLLTASNRLTYTTLSIFKQTKIASSSNSKVAVEVNLLPLLVLELVSVLVVVLVLVLVNIKNKHRWTTERKCHESNINVQALPLPRKLRRNLAVMQEICCLALGCLWLLPCVTVEHANLWSGCHNWPAVTASLRLKRVTQDIISTVISGPFMSCISSQHRPVHLIASQTLHLSIIPSPSWPVGVRSLVTKLAFDRHPASSSASNIFHCIGNFLAIFLIT